MQFEVTEVDNIKRQVNVSITPEDLAEIETKVVQQIKKSASLPGFRKGHVPVGLLKKSYADAIKKEVLESAISKYYIKVLDESKLNPISQGQISNLKFENVNAGLEFQIELEVEPVINLRKYKDLTVERETPVVTEEMIDESLEGIRQNFATVKVVDQAAEGHLVNLTIQELGEGDVPIVGRKYDNVVVKLGSGEFEPELEKQLVGIKEEEDRILRKTVVLPDAPADQPPKIESYKATAVSIEEQELPELDDEFVKNLGDDNLDTMEQLRDDIRQRMLERFEVRSKQQVHSRLIDEVLKENPFDVPESMVDNYLKSIAHDMQHKNPKAKVDEEAIRKQYRVDAIYEIRWHLLKQAIAKAENINVSDEEVFQKITLLPYSEEEKASIRNNDTFIEQIRQDMLDEKVKKFLELNAKITETKPDDTKDAGKSPSGKKTAPEKTETVKEKN